MIEIFQQYSNNDKEADTLSKTELKELLEVELRAVLKNPDDQDIADVFMQMLDIDHDEKIDFTEYLLMVVKLTQAYYESSQNKGFRTGSKRRRRRHHTVEEDGEERPEKRSKSGRADGKERGDRTRSPRGKGKKRHGSGSKTQNREKITHKDTEKQEKHHKSLGRKTRESTYTEKNSKYTRVVGSQESMHEKAWTNYYYEGEKGKKQEREETTLSNNTPSPEQSPDSHRPAQSHQREESSRGHAGSHRGSSATGSRGRHLSPEGHQSPDSPRQGAPRSDRYRADSASQDSDSESHTQVDLQPRLASSGHTRGGPNSGFLQDTLESQSGDNSNVNSKHLGFSQSLRYYYYQ
ncbi:profilaggrin [Sigmodon hispidus]